MQRKKVMFFIYQMGSGGAARTFLNILNHMDRHEFEPILVTLDFNGNYEEELLPHVRLIKLEVKRLRSAIFPLARVLRKEKPDILISTIPTYNIIATLAKVVSRTKTQLIVREAAYLGGSVRENTSLFVVGCFYRLAQRVISLSEGVKDNLIKRYKVQHRKIKVIYNPIDLDRIKTLANQSISNQNHKAIFQSSPITMITAGRLEEEKDHDTLLRAFSIIRKEIDANLIILGEGTLKGALKGLAKKLNIEQKVHFLGFQNNPYQYFKQADLFLLSSLHEGFGHVLVEALAVGTPVVSTDCLPGAREVLENGKYGTLANVGDAEDLAKKIIKHLQQPEEVKEKKVAKGKQRAKDFYVKKIVRQYESLFREVIRQR